MIRFNFCSVAILAFASLLTVDFFYSVLFVIGHDISCHMCSNGHFCCILFSTVICRNALCHMSSKHVFLCSSCLFTLTIDSFPIPLALAIQIDLLKAGLRDMQDVQPHLWAFWRVIKLKNFGEKFGKVLEIDFCHKIEFRVKIFTLEGTFSENC